MGDLGTLLGDVCTDGFVVVRSAVAPHVVSSCVQVLENELRMRGVEPGDPATWTEPVVRFVCPEGPDFAAAGTSPALWKMYDALLGPGRLGSAPGGRRNHAGAVPQHEG